MKGNCKRFIFLKLDGTQHSKYPYLERRVKGVAHARVLRLHLGLLSAEAYLLRVFDRA